MVGPHSLLARVPVVGEDASGRVVNVATFPVAVWHPVVLDPFGLAREEFLKDVAVEQGFLGKWCLVGVLFAGLGHVFIRVLGVGVFL